MSKSSTIERQTRQTRQTRQAQQSILKSSKWTGVCLVILLFNLAVSARDQTKATEVSEGDVRQEKKLYDIYKKYHEAPMNENSWRQLIKSTKAMNYRIQKGDNLWDISDTLFGDPNFWPKIWSLNNSEIFNPHEIKPRMNVQFVPGNMSEPPQVSIQDEKAPLVSEEVYSDNYWIELPDASRRGKNLTPMPKSLPDWKFGRARQETTEFDLHAFVMPHLNPEEPLTYYISEQEIQRHGTIISTELDSKSAIEFQYVFVQLDDPQAAKTYTVLGIQGKVADPYRQKNGYVISVQGEIEIVDKVNDEANIYRAIVTRVVSPILKGSQVVIGSIPAFRSQNFVPGKPVEGQVIGGNFSSRRSLIAEKGLAFVNAGTDDGLQIGQLLKIFRNDYSRLLMSPVESNPRFIAEAVVVNTEARVSTLFILRGIEEIKIGDGLSPQSVISPSVK